MRLPDSILTEKLIPIARGVVPDRAVELAAALRAGGSYVLEITLESGDGIASIRALSGAGMTVGAGTVTTIEDAEAAIGAGAGFLVSPHFDPNLVEWAIENNVAYLPGVFSPTEVAAVLSLGLRAMKVFPASVGGPDLIRSLRGPFPRLEAIATGGVGIENASEYRAAGAVAVGVGTWLTGPEDLALITERTKALLAVV
jgi:2-dehydro-3-deoxyphosphogluconate aldolase/(4S)-4-hydroxy-2-oxoglutarate aldolase